MTEQVDEFSILVIQIRAEPDIVTCRQKTRRISKDLGFDSQDQIRLATAVSELARNVFQYAQKGSVEFRYSLGAPQMLSIIVSDMGPGISAIDQILRGTYVSKSGMGVGLIGTKKIMDLFEIETSKGTGTRIKIGKLLGRKSREVDVSQLQKLAIELVSTYAANPFEELRNQNRDLLNALEEVRSVKENLANLNSELADTNQALQLATAEAELANHAKSRFLSNMSHEIRTPLGVIQGFADLAADEQLTSEERNEFLITIRRNADNLTKLIGEILDLSKVEAGHIDIESVRFSLPELITDVVVALDLQAKDKAITLKADYLGRYPKFVISDSTRLRQILVNVINNAIKFTSHGGVTITTRLLDGNLGAEPSCVEINIKDSGIGLSPEQQTRLFQAFMQADSSTTRKFGGTGLGLNLSKKLAQALGGDLTLSESIEGQGSTFKIVFSAGLLNEADLDEVSAQRTVSLAPSTTSTILVGMSVLLVEDSTDNQKLFSRYLTRAGAKVEIANDGFEGIELARKRVYDVVLMDIQMPNLDGYGATSVLRGEGYTVPIIALTAHALREDRELALTKGFSHYLTKPLNAELLVETLASIKDHDLASCRDAMSTNGNASA